MAQSQYGEQIIRIHAAERIASAVAGQPGEVIAYDKTGLLIGCQPGQLRVTKCQLPGAKAMQIADIYNGHPTLFNIGTCFSPPPHSQ